MKSEPGELQLSEDMYGDSEAGMPYTRSDGKLRGAGGIGRCEVSVKLGKVCGL